MRLIYLLLLAKYNIVLQRQYKIPSPIFWYVFLSTSILHFTLSQLRNRFFGVRSLCLLECVVSYSQNTLSIDKLIVKNILYLDVCGVYPLQHGKLSLFGNKTLNSGFPGWRGDGQPLRETKMFYDDEIMSRFLEGPKQIF